MNKSIFFSIRGKFVFFIALPISLIYIGALLFTFYFASTESEDAMKDRMEKLADQAAKRVQNFMANAALIAELTADFAENTHDLDEEEIYAMLRANVKNEKRIYGSAMAFEPGVVFPGKNLYAPYVYRKGDELVSMNITRDVYDWYDGKEWQWWSLAKNKKKGVWTDPYFDKGAGNVLMTTYSVPFYKRGQFAGVVTVDIELPNLKDELASGLDKGYKYYIFTNKGQMVFSDNPDDILSVNIFDQIKDLGNDELVDLMKSMQSNHIDVIPIHGLQNHELHLLAYTKIPTNQWFVAIKVPLKEALNEFYEDLPIIISPFIAAFILTFGAIFLVSGSLVKPILQLQKTVGLIADGDLDAKVEAASSHDEIGILARSVNKMTMRLKSQISRIATEERDRLQAEEQSNAKGIFLSHMSHELRTPLHGILGYTQVISKDPNLSSKKRKAVDSIVSCGNYLLGLINDILDLSKIESGKMELVFESTNLGKILKDVSDIIYVRAHEAKLQYVVEVSPDIPDWLVTDGAKLKQVLINLLANAVKFTEAGTVRLDVKSRGKNFIEFLVIDSGIGISEEEQSFIFDPFKQAERGSGKGGSGLGLSISKQLAEKLGGRLGLSSEFGKGSTFTLLLPLKLPEEGIKIQPLSGSEEISVQELNNFTQMKIQFDTMVMERKQVEGARVSYKISHSDYQAMLDAMQIMNVTSMKKICIKMNEDPNFAESGKKMIDFVESFAFDELRGFLESLEKV